jgi:tRNA 2-thiouridine synthesizing protein A
MPFVKLDVRGNCCPMPLIQLAKAVDGLEPGARIEIVGDDPIFELGVREFCAARGFSVEKKTVEGREVRLELRVSPTGEDT